MDDTFMLGVHIGLRDGDDNLISCGDTLKHKYTGEEKLVSYNVDDCSFNMCAPTDNERKRKYYTLHQWKIVKKAFEPIT